MTDIPQEQISRGHAGGMIMRGVFSFGCRFKGTALGAGIAAYLADKGIEINDSNYGSADLTTVPADIAPIQQLLHTFKRIEEEHATRPKTLQDVTVEVAKIIKAANATIQQLKQSGHDSHVLLQLETITGNVALREVVTEYRRDDHGVDPHAAERTGYQPPSMAETARPAESSLKGYKVIPTSPRPGPDKGPGSPLLDNGTPPKVTDHYKPGKFKKT